MTTLNPIEAALSERVRALERQCAVLSAEIDRQRPVVEMAVDCVHKNGMLPELLIEVVHAYEASAPK